jgi:hypothetical protein
MDGYISKPVNRAQLIAIVDKHLVDQGRTAGQGGASPACAAMMQT